MDAIKLEQSHVALLKLAEDALYMMGCATFSNGVTAPDGTEEAEVWAAGVQDDLRVAIDNAKELNITKRTMVVLEEAEMVVLRHLLTNAQMSDEETGEPLEEQPDYVFVLKHILKKLGGNLEYDDESDKWENDEKLVTEFVERQKEWTKLR